MVMKKKTYLGNSELDNPLGGQFGKSFFWGGNMVHGKKHRKGVKISKLCERACFLNQLFLNCIQKFAHYLQQRIIFDTNHAQRSARLVDIKRRS